MKLNTPDLLQLHSPTENDPNIEQCFIKMLCSFIQRNALSELILYQTEDILVINITICLSKSQSSLCLLANCQQCFSIKI